MIPTFCPFEENQDIGECIHVIQNSSIDCEVKQDEIVEADFVIFSKDTRYLGANGRDGEGIHAPDSEE
jgi:hypothetical protein